MVLKQDVLHCLVTAVPAVSVAIIIPVKQEVEGIPAKEHGVAALEGPAQVMHKLGEEWCGGVA